MNIQDPQEIRRAFGQAIIDYRHGSRRKISQGELCAATCSNLNKEMAKQLYQEKLSKIERGYKQPVLPERIIVAISDYCSIPADIRDAYLNLNYKLSRTEEVAKVCVTGHGQLITSKERSEFKIYLGEYNCYFVSTESQKDKVIHGIMNITDSDKDNPSCVVRFSILDNLGKPIKSYKGQFFINIHYRAWYCILLGDNMQEVCFLMSIYTPLTINNNSFSVALAMTTSAGKKKWPTAHKMVLSRNPLSNRTLNSIKPQLKLNSNAIRITESELNDIEEAATKILASAKSPKKIAQYQAVLASINIIKQIGKKEVCYSFDEVQIMKNTAISSNIKNRAFAITAIRSKTDDRYKTKLNENMDAFFPAIEVAKKTNKEPKKSE